MSVVFFDPTKVSTRENLSGHRRNTAGICTSCLLIGHGFLTPRRLLVLLAMPLVAASAARESACNQTFRRMLWRVLHLQPKTCLLHESWLVFCQTSY